MADLFRKEAVDSQKAQLFGTVILALPPTFARLTALAATVAICGITFTALASYARKETVAGHVSTESGLARVHPPRAGVVGKLLVNEGATVRQGQPILTLVERPPDASGASPGDRKIAAMESQIRQTDARIEIAGRMLQSRQSRIAAEIGGLSRERASVLEQIAAQKSLIDTLQSSLDRLKDIVASGYLSRIDYASRREDLLRNRASAAALQQSLVSLDSRIQQSRLAHAQLPVEFREQVAELLATRSQLQLRLLEQVDMAEVVIHAPIAGTVATIQAAPGSSVDPGRLLLNIVPQDEILQAELFVPTRAIGFVEVGQNVRLQYEAYDYRTFGVQPGYVDEISATPLLPSDARYQVGISEPAYRVKVRLERQHVSAHGARHPLQPGMLLAADIVLEERSILSWIFDPLIRLRGRM